MTGRLFCGTSGWTYPPWRGVFYPKGVRQRDELPYMASRVSSIEINGSFYSLQRPSAWTSWYAQTPPGFVFAVKGPRFITHMKKLNDVRTPLANFYASGVLALREKLGPCLWQLPPNLGFDAARLATFFSELPRSTMEAVALAHRHDERMTDRTLLTTDADRPIRHALEVRHASFVTPDFLALLREHRIAVVVADTAGKWPLLRETTADFAYVRLHGDQELYVSGYTDEALDAWAATVRPWLDAGLDTYAYFDNDVKVRAPVDAMGLARRLDAYSPTTAR
ncbi:MAG: DUF72 domain-containing protein [Jatrophihabitans sp.]|uniref:DUF72 domain-containing protein n=1 Tax=Jatrophihabitans sp. TaxID=1932789 RepID=UPI003F80F3C0